jgi:hypothetical protein
VTDVTAQDARLLEGITPDFIGWFGYRRCPGMTKQERRPLGSKKSKTPAAPLHRLFAWMTVEGDGGGGWLNINSS